MTLNVCVTFIFAQSYYLTEEMYLKFSSFYSRRLFFKEAWSGAEVPFPLLEDIKTPLEDWTILLEADKKDIGQFLVSLER